MRAPTRLAILLIGTTGLAGASLALRAEAAPNPLKDPVQCVRECGPTLPTLPRIETAPDGFATCKINGLEAASAPTTANTRPPETIRLPTVPTIQKPIECYY